MLIFFIISYWIFFLELVLENGKAATLPFTEPIQLILRISEVLGSQQKKKKVKNDLLSCDDHFKIRPDNIYHTFLDNKNLIPDWGGQYFPAKDGQGHWFFHYPLILEYYLFSVFLFL